MLNIFGCVTANCKDTETRDVVATYVRTLQTSLFAKPLKNSVSNQITLKADKSDGNVCEILTAAIKVVET